MSEDASTEAADTRVAEAMTFVEHLAELRSRIVKSLIGVAIGTVIVLVAYERILEFLVRPYVELCASRESLECDGSLYSFGPVEGFTARMRISAYGGLILALPIVTWQVWRFIVPALSKRERRYSRSFIVAAVILFAAGSALAYWTLGKALEFLIGWAGEDITQAFQITKYVGLVGLMMAAFGVGFLAPLLVVFLQLVEVVTPRTLLRQWRTAILVILVTAAVITPSGDPVSLAALAVPMIVLYALAIALGAVVMWRRRRRMRHV